MDIATRTVSNAAARVAVACLLLSGLAFACTDPSGAKGAADVPATAQDTAAIDAAAPADAAADIGAGVDAATQDAATAADATGPDVAPPQPKVLTTFIGDWTMKPKQEMTRCVIKRLANTDTVWVNAIKTKLGKGSHHVVVYRSDATEEKKEPFNCTPFTETLSGGNVPMMITQIPEETLQLPKGVAFPFAAGQMIRIESHYLNYFQDDIVAHVDVEFHNIPKSELVHEADMLFYGTPDLSLPPGKATTNPWFFIDVWPGTKIFALTGHTHKLGTNVQVAMADNATHVDAPLVYPGVKPYTWEEAPIVQFAKPLEFTKPGQGFSYRCSWFNDTKQHVGFGESANKEMCFFWAYYYPSKGYRMCMNLGKYKDQSPVKVGDQVCCPDDSLCSLIKIYLGQI